MQPETTAEPSRENQVSAIQRFPKLIRGKQQEVALVALGNWVMSLIGRTLGSASYKQSHKVN